MLHDLSITNFAIIDELHVSFADGLNIISGETGAGKSILIGAVSLLLGDRATAEMIRTKMDTATVEALFNIQNNKPLQEKLTAMGFSAGAELVIRRVISRTGRNRTYLNGNLCPVHLLEELGGALVDVHGQHEQQIFPAPASQRTRPAGKRLLQQVLGGDGVDADAQIVVGRFGEQGGEFRIASFAITSVV